MNGDEKRMKKDKDKDSKTQNKERKTITTMNNASKMMKDISVLIYMCSTEKMLSSP